MDAVAASSSEHRHQPSAMHPSLRHDQPEALAPNPLSTLLAITRQVKRRRRFQGTRNKQLRWYEPATRHVLQRLATIRRGARNRRGDPMVHAAARRPGRRADPAEGAIPNHACALPAFWLLLRSHQGFMRRAETAPSPGKLLTACAPGAPLPAPVRLAEVRAPLRTLVAPIRYATPPTAMPHAAIGATAGALGAPWCSTPFAASMHHAEAGSSMNTFGTCRASLEEAPLPATMPFT